MNILAIETSCDETAFALGSGSGRDFRLLSNTVLSQIGIHEKFGGVVPNLSAREHLKNFKPLLKKTLKQAGVRLRDIDCLSVTSGPGLIPALLVGVSAAKALAYFLKKPLIGTHHIEGHIYGAWIKKNGKLRQDIKFPLIALVVSGGHTQLVFMKNHLDYEVIGETLDDACGEAFDKTARLLGLSYPGGPAIAALAEQVKARKPRFDLPRPMINSDNLDFSFSGLKTAVMYLVKKEKKEKKKISLNFKQELGFCFEQSVVDVLVKKTKKAAEQFKPRAFILAGGVAANKKLRKEIKNNLQEKNVLKCFPLLKYCGDNAAMQLPAAFQKIEKHGLDAYKNNWKKLGAKAEWRLKNAI
ncbi:MAG: tRNA (adenosine(37)-N6)-threonylcarbamoyltransferase complex transferase subunit TsaD [Patescibacteria group bacterium]